MRAPPAATDRYAAWRTAERAALSGGSPSLPGRQGLLLRCMAALDRGQRDEITALRDELAQAGDSGRQHGDMVLILDMVLTNSPDPSATHRVAKKGYASGRAGLPTADLLKMAAQHRTGGKPRGSKRLNQWARQRPVLSLVVQLLQRKVITVSPVPVVRHQLPRAEAIAVLCTVMGHGAARSHIGEFFPTLSDHVDLSRYPGWDGGAAERRLERWLRGAPGEEWDADLADAVASSSHTPIKERQQILCGLLDRVDRDLREGRALQALDVLRSTISLAKIGHMSLRGALARLSAQLTLLIDPTRSSGRVLNALWGRGLRLSADERSVIAGLLLDQEDRLEDHVFMDVIRFVLGHGTDWDRRVEVAEHHARSMPDDLFRRILSVDPHPARRATLLGLHAAANGKTELAIRMVPTMLQDPRLVSLGVEVFERSAEAHAGACTFKPGAPWLAAAEAIAQVDIPLRSGPTLLSALHDLGEGGSELLSPIVASLRRNLARRPSDGSTLDLALRIVILDLLGDTDGVRGVLRSAGRQLRTLPADAADDRALLLIARTYDAHPAQPDPKLLAPITRFLLREGPERPEAAARRLPVEQALRDAIGAWSEDWEDELGNPDVWLPFQIGIVSGASGYWCPGCGKWHEGPIP